MMSAHIIVYKHDTVQYILWYLFSASRALVHHPKLLSAWNRVSANIVNAPNVVSFAQL
jgi:hypothetical protein